MQLILNTSAHHSGQKAALVMRQALSKARGLGSLCGGRFPLPTSRSSVSCSSTFRSTTDSSPRTPPLASPTGTPRVCIVGGGFGGLYAALKLDALSWPQGKRPEITLIDRNERFVFKPLLYELINGTAQALEVAPIFPELVASSGVRFIKGEVARIQPGAVTAASTQGKMNAAGVLTLKDGSIVHYDWLVMAMGSDVAPRDVPGAVEHALPFNTYDDAKRVDDKLKQLEDARRGVGSIVVGVVGGGYAGVELAATVAERLGPKGRVVMLASGQDILEGGTTGHRDEAKSALSRLGVQILTSSRVIRLTSIAGAMTVQEAEELELRQVPSGSVVEVSYSDGRKEMLETDVVLWTAGAKPVTRNDRSNPPPRDFPFPLDARGAIKTDPALRVLEHPHVFAVGDVATVDPTTSSSTSPPLAPTAQVALQQADYVAWNIHAAINRRPLLPFRYQHLGSMMSLGRTSGAITLPLPRLPREVADMVKSVPVVSTLLEVAGVRVGEDVTVGGILGQAVRRAAYWYRQPTQEQRVKVGLSFVDQAQRAMESVLGGMSDASPNQQPSSSSAAGFGSPGSAGSSPYSQSTDPFSRK